MLLGSGNLLLMGGAFFLYKKYQAAQAEAERLGSRESGPLPTERPAGTAGSTGRTDDLTRRSEEEERERERESTALAAPIGATEFGPQPAAVSSNSAADLGICTAAALYVARQHGSYAAPALHISRQGHLLGHSTPPHLPRLN